MPKGNGKNEKENVAEQASLLRSYNHHVASADSNSSRVMRELHAKKAEEILKKAKKKGYAIGPVTVE